ncbi:hypothetical protein [Litoribaculum gwangyangense]|uniref:Glycine dehydrogenase n=1 Tax=Litoribaculum gwangyangense TaxID=1130722 RepID=A0ABP9C658_9FLAO
MAKIKFLIPCDEANHTCDKTQYKEATLWEKIKLNIHLIYCRACRDYTKKNTKLTSKIKVSKIDCLDKKVKETMKKDFENALKDHVL